MYFLGALIIARLFEVGYTYCMSTVHIILVVEHAEYMLYDSHNMDILVQYKTRTDDFYKASPAKIPIVLIIYIMIYTNIHVNEFF